MSTWWRELKLVSYSKYSQKFIAYMILLPCFKTKKPFVFWNFGCYRCLSWPSSSTYCNSNYCIYWGQWIRKTVYDVSFRSTWFDLAGNNLIVIVCHCHFHFLWNMGINVLIESYLVNLLIPNFLPCRKGLTSLQLLLFCNWCGVSLMFIVLPYVDEQCFSFILNAMRLYFILLSVLTL